MMAWSCVRLIVAVGVSGPGGSGIGDCCMTFSRVKHDGNTIMYVGKKTSPNTTNNFEWGYKVKKDGVVVEGKVLDSRGYANFNFGGIEPPPLSAWQPKSWQVVDQYERPRPGWASRSPFGGYSPSRVRTAGAGTRSCPMGEKISSFSCHPAALQ